MAFLTQHFLYFVLTIATLFTAVWLISLRRQLDMHPIMTSLTGVHIGTGRTLIVCAVGTKEVPPMSVAADVPARVIRRRDEGEGECL